MAHGAALGCMAASASLFSCAMCFLWGIPREAKLKAVPARCRGSSWLAANHWHHARSVGSEEVAGALSASTSELKTGGASGSEHGRVVRASTAGSQASSAGGSSSSKSDPLVIYVLLRTDLDWPVGALINQACHAVAAVAWEARTDEEAAVYLSEAEGQMVKATLGVSSEADLTKAAEKLRAAGLPFKLWVEQPEDIPVCIATWPRRRSEFKRPLKGFRRF
mmetsp:Transcript_64206/g.139677  ORF Transcript_64206/g.139677 Transcript_64206/m.139677 type:complete len:221 (+) Transcript_64206:40-702(+)|eukprot:CAMPEP_0170570316 /NCGR_PEP_ID=MMETSP0224-20130122/1041_1 /TAXON_ID=285029 /ORGANISM="Togula jolla, Strain CCCM 725" /LENGTH=220 /DNA_ID=CAMNT_0010892577 /DNA_START=35 /DNA_END=697 /DNA_ORIENTATION=+